MSERKFTINKESNRYELHIDEFVALAEYHRDDNGVVYITHTEVPVELSGQGIASELIKNTLEDIKKNGLKVFPVCSFVVTYIEKHPEWQSLVAK